QGSQISVSGYTSALDNEYVFHALVLDEHWKNFEPTFWTRTVQAEQAGVPERCRMEEERSSCATPKSSTSKLQPAIDVRCGAPSTDAAEVGGRACLPPTCQSNASTLTRRPL